MYFATTMRENYIIVCIETGRTKKIGRIGKGRGINYHDRAKEEATRRNGGISAKYVPEWRYQEYLDGTRTLGEMMED